MKKKLRPYFLLISSFLLSLFLFNCSPSSTSTLTIATAANMQFAMDSLANAFQDQTGIKVQTIVSSSGKLTAQIREGAPFDVFVSADLKYPQVLFEEGFTQAPPKVYANGKLVLWSFKANLQPQIQSLTQSEIKHIALANPKTAPYGLAAEAVLKYYQLYDSLKSKLVFGESIAQTNQFVVSGAAEIGFTAKAVALSPTLTNQAQWLELPDNTYPPIAQGVVILKNRNQNLSQSQQFYDFLFSPKGKQILDTFGYETNVE